MGGGWRRWGHRPSPGRRSPIPKGPPALLRPPVLLRGAVMGSAAPRVGAAAPQLPWGGAGGATRSAAVPIAVPIALHGPARNGAPTRRPDGCWGCRGGAAGSIPCHGDAPHAGTHLAAPSPPLTPHTARCPRAELGVAQPSPPCCPAVPLCSQAAPADGSGGADVWHCIARSARTAERTHVRRERFNAEPSALPARPRRKHRVPPRCCREEQ